MQEFTGLEQKIGKAQTYIENNSLIISRLQTTNRSIDETIDTANELQALLTLRRNPTNAENIGFAQQARALMQEFASHLNRSVEGRFLFSGSRADVQPVIDDPMPLPVEVGVPDASYYQGSTEDLTVRVQDNFSLQYNVRADNPAFQKIFAAFHQGLEAHTQNDDQLLEKSLELVGEGLEELIGVQATVNSNIITLESINDRHEDLKLYFQGVSEQLVNTDIVEASTLLALDQATLQAAFQAFATVNQLRLSDFL